MMPHCCVDIKHLEMFAIRSLLNGHDIVMRPLKSIDHIET